MTTYRESGVDTELKMGLSEKLKQQVASTFTEHSIQDKTMFKFGGGVSLKAFKEYEEPVLVTSTDGVGTKLMVAALMDRWDTVGEDIVNHCANDVFTSGAKPLFFLDYVAAERLEPKVIEAMVAGVARACRKLGVILAGGETAEMPGVYSVGQHDLAGTMGGIVERKNMVTGSRIAAGDVLIGLGSSGLHTNGYSLARKALFEMGGYKADDDVEALGTSIGRALLEPHRAYVRSVLPLVEAQRIRGMAHITGGGLTDNLPRILKPGLGAEIRKCWEVPPLFSLIQQKGSVPEADMFRTFNMGVGMVLVVAKEDAAGVVEHLKGKERVFEMGSVKAGAGVRYVDG